MSQTHMRSEHGSTISTPPGTPRWVKVIGVITFVVILLFIIVTLVGGGQHGPNLHIPSSDTGETLSTEAGGHRPPAGIPDHSGP